MPWRGNRWPTGLTCHVLFILHNRENGQISRQLYVSDYLWSNNKYQQYVTQWKTEFADNVVVSIIKLTKRCLQLRQLKLLVYFSTCFSEACLVLETVHT